MAASLVDFFIVFVMLLAMTLKFGIRPGLHALMLPVFLLLAVATALGVGLWLSALNALHRDVRYVTPFLRVEESTTGCRCSLALSAVSSFGRRFVKGWFKDTLRPFLQEFSPRSRLVIHNDGDLFSSTLFTLATLDPILRRGSILIFDEFANSLHEWRAFQDYTSAFGRTCKVLGAAGEYYTQVAMEIE